MVSSSTVVSATKLEIHLNDFVCFASARPWLRDDLDAWIERSKVGLLFPPAILSFFRSCARCLNHLFVRLMIL